MKLKFGLKSGGDLRSGRVTESNIKYSLIAHGVLAFNNNIQTIFTVPKNIRLFSYAIPGQPRFDLESFNIQQSCNYNEHVTFIVEPGEEISELTLYLSQPIITNTGNIPPCILKCSNGEITRLTDINYKTFVRDTVPLSTIINLISSTTSSIIDVHLLPCQSISPSDKARGAVLNNEITLPQTFASQSLTPVQILPFRNSIFGPTPPIQQGPQDTRYAYQASQVPWPPVQPSPQAPWSFQPTFQPQPQQQAPWALTPSFPQGPVFPPVTQGPFQQQNPSLFQQSPFFRFGKSTNIKDIDNDIKYLNSI